MITVEKIAITDNMVNQPVCVNMDKVYNGNIVQGAHAYTMIDGISLENILNPIINDLASGKIVTVYNAYYDSEGLVNIPVDWDNYVHFKYEINRVFIDYDKFVYQFTITPFVHMLGNPDGKGNRRNFDYPLVDRKLSLTLNNNSNSEKCRDNIFANLSNIDAMIFEIEGCTTTIF